MSDARRSAVRRTRLLVTALERRDVPATYTVTTTADTGAGSLRQAVLAANSNGGADSIVFDPAAFATAKTITLTSGELAVTDSLTVTGPSAATLTLALGTAAPSRRVFNVNGPGQISVTLANLTLTNAAATTFGGSGSTTTFGAIAIDNKAATVTNCAFVGNKASSTGSGYGAGIGLTGAGGRLTVAGCTFTGGVAFYGGGIFASAAGVTVAVSDSTFTGNTAGGGAVWVGGTGSAATFTRCTLTNNTATASVGGGGAASVSTGATLTLIDSLVAGNKTATASGSGGAIYAEAATVTIVNSTVANNTAALNGGAIFIGSSAAALTVSNSTVVGNSAKQYGGAVSAGGASVTVTDSVFAGNTVAYGSYSGPNIFQATVAYSRSAIDDLGGFAAQAGAGNVPAGADLRLMPLGDYGGTRQSVAFRFGSPLHNAGANPLGLTLDGRGLPRTVGAGTDIGAYERPLGAGPAGVTVPAVTAAGTAYTFGVAFGSDGSPVDPATLAGNTKAVTVTGPGGPLTVTAAVLDGNTVTYTATPPGGVWDATDFGTYTVSLGGGQVFDTTGAALAAVPALATFAVRYGVTFTVTNTLDDNSAGSLRWAVAQANALTATADAVQFAAGLAGTITLASQLVNTDTLTVSGAGASVTVTGANGVFNAGKQLALADFTVRGAKAGAGAGLIVPSYVTATLTRMRFADNAVTGSGGAVMGGTYAHLVISDSTFTANTAAGNGGAISTAGDIDATAARFSGNAAQVGGAVYLAATGSGYLRRSLLTANTAATTGGAVAADTYVYVDNSTFADNVAGSATATGAKGGAISAAGTLTATNATVVGNRVLGANGQGGGLALAAGASLAATVVAGNDATVGPDLFRAANVTPTLDLRVSLIGVGDSGFSGASESATLKGTLASPLDPQLGPLQNNGGPMPTREPLAGSPLIDAGDN